MNLLEQSGAAKVAARRRREPLLEDIIDVLLSRIDQTSREAQRAWRAAGKRPEDFGEPEDVLEMMQQLRGYAATLAAKYTHRELGRVVNEIAARGEWRAGQRLCDLSLALDGWETACGRYWRHR